MEEERGGPAGHFEDLEVIRVDAGMPTARFVKLIGVPERSYRRWQAKARVGARPKDPWPQPAGHAAQPLVTKHALAKPEWGHRKQRRQLAKDRKAAFARTPTGPNQVWQLDFSEFETTQGGTWRIAGCRDWFSKLEHPFHVSPTANQYDAIAAIELALAEYERLFGHPLVDTCQVDEETGELLPVLTIVTDNGGPFRSLNFELFIMRHPELRHVRTKVKSPGRTGHANAGSGR